MNGKPEIRVDMMSLPDMPAIAFTIADDFCGCGGCGESQLACCAQDRGENAFHKENPKSEHEKIATSPIWSFAASYPGIFFFIFSFLYTGFAFSEC
jgi:hypothetical protein